LLDLWAQYSVSIPPAYGQTTAPITPCGYLPAQLRSAANINKQINAGYDGIYVRDFRGLLRGEWYPPVDGPDRHLL
jgi:hypothetical protein